ncbi:hypothetical protein V5P93_003647 [Actinokineospora auranticolor]|uniref:Uncharacterized protein n=1 Tax=Actinokineospora auranticolor TaxID=155976 RepID=A0A2S6GJ34_9PSEU|nr:hypothetical protein [Actinokineospora auranticolor]PPK65210.1 hypothetical protein CLV40_11557 [Actinokineospora auranticolor]
MGWLGRKHKPRFPPDMVRRLEYLGRYEFDSPGSGLDAVDVQTRCVAPFHDGEAHDRDAFIADLRALVTEDGSEFATYGAGCLVVELFGQRVDTPDALAVLDAAIEVKRVRGLPSAALKGYEWQRWLSVHGQGTWPNRPRR